MRFRVSPDGESRASSRRRRLHGWRRIAFPLGALLLALLPFVVLECVLALFDVGSRIRCGDPFVGFSRIQPLFELDEDDDVYRTARSRQLSFGQQQFPRKKPEGTFRIFGLGGSTLRGRPYETDTSLLEWLKIELNGRDSTRHCETVNCGGLSYASYRLTLILDEVLQYEPDLIIVATGHNEFLEDRSYDSTKNRSPLESWVLERLYSLRTVTLARQLRDSLQADADDDRPVLDAEVNTRLDSRSGYASYRRDDEWRSRVIEHFELSVRGMVDTCRRAQVPMILVNLGENLRDCPPFKSEHKAGLSVASQQRWQQLFDRATELEETSPEDALRVYRKAESIDGEHALLIYHMAQCFDRLGKMEEARRYYARAKDLDVCPLRMLDEMHDRLKRIAHRTGTPLLDAQQLLVDLSPDGIPGNNCFMDHVHPDIGSHQRIAQALAARMEEISLAPGNRRWQDSQRRLAYRRHFVQLGPAYLANGRRRVGWLEDWARRNLVDGETVPKDARAHLHLGQKRLDYGQYNSAWGQFQSAMEENPALAGDVLDYALELLRQGRGNLAKGILLRLHGEPKAAAIRRQTELAWLILALDAGRIQEAGSLYTRYRDAIEQAAQSSRGWLDLMPDALQRVKAEVARRSPQPEAEPFPDPFERGMAHHTGSPQEKVPGDVEASELGPKQAVDARDVASDQQGDSETAAANRDGAIRLLDEAIRRTPDNPRLYLIRARLHGSAQDFDAAMKDSAKAIQLAPADAAGYRFRAAVYTIQGKLKEALADLTKAIDIDPSDPDVFTVRGSVYERLGEPAKAEADFAKAKKLTGGKQGAAER